MPVFLAESAIAQWQVELESLGARGGNFPCPRRVLSCSGLNRHFDLRGSWRCIEHFADLVFQVAKVEWLLEQANAGIQSAVVTDHVFCVTGHVENFHV